MVTQPRRRRAVALALTAVTAGALLQLPALSASAAQAADTTSQTVSTDALPTAQVDGVVWSQVVIGDTVYAGGSFTTATPAGAAAGAPGVARSNLLAYDVRTGVLKAGFAPVLNAQVRALAASPDGRTLYVGGEFSTVNGTAKNRIAALDPTTGALRTGWSGKANSAVYAITASASTVYFGGTFSSANGVARTRAAAVDATTGALRPWAPVVADNVVRAMVVSPAGDKVVLGGSFSSLNGQTSPGSGLGAVDGTTGASLPWNVGKLIYNHGTKSAIFSLSTDGTDVYGTGYVYGPGGNLEGAFNAAWADGTINWLEDCHGDSYSSAALDGVLYTASHAHFCGDVPGGFPQTDPWHYQRGMAFSLATAGTLGHNPWGGYADFAGQPAPSVQTWYPELAAGKVTGQSQAAWSVVAAGDYVLYAGEFPTVNGKRQAGLVRFPARRIAPNADGPRISGSAWTPTATSTAAGTVQVAFPSNWDRDDAQLSYTLLRDGVAVSTTQAVSQAWWVRPDLTATDTSAVPGSTATYRVRATDPHGNSATSAPVTVSVMAGQAAGAGDGATRASDAFERTFSGGLGSADAGGAWTVSSASASAYSVASGAARFATAAGATRTATLQGVSSASSDVAATATVPSLPVAGSVYVGVVGRKVGSDDYSGRAVIAADGSVTVSVLHGSAALRSAKVPGLTAAAGTPLRVRLQTTGTGTTTLQARVWRTGSSEPAAWQVTATDTTAGLQAAGSVGLRSYLGAGVSNGPSTVAFDDFVTAAL